MERVLGVGVSCVFGQELEAVTCAVLRPQRELALQRSSHPAGPKLPRYALQYRQRDIRGAREEIESAACPRNRCDTKLITLPT